MKPMLISIKHYLPLLFSVVAIKAHSQDKPYLSRPASGNQLNIIKQNGAKIISFDAGRSIIDSGKYSIWLETGDGNYASNFSSGTTDILTITPASSIVTKPFMIATRLYEHHRPPSASSSFIPQNIGTLGTLSSIMLGQKSVTLFSNVHEIVAGDTMVFGISYSTPQMNTNGNYKLVFRYNKSDQKTFVPVTNTSNKVRDYTTANSSVDVQNIRVFNNEMIDIQNTSSGADLGGYKNAIVFNGINMSSNKFNIFISLVPNDAITERDSDDLEAVLYYQDKEGAEPLKVDESHITGMQILSAHDPNRIQVSPTCLSLPQTTRVLHYTIDFQNTGLGDADEVIAVFNAPDQMNTQGQIRNVKLTYAGNPVRTLTTLTPNPDYVIDNNKIIFTINGTLSGCKDLANAVTNTKTMGSISFDLEVMPSPNVQTPAMLQAWAEIYFHSAPDTRLGALILTPSPDFKITAEMESKGLVVKGTTGFEMPIRTNNAITLFSKCCGEVEECNCKHPKKFLQWVQCYWWVLIIVLSLIVILWLSKKLRHQK